jgi:NADPH:quinone reductase-like Zn-dependent oxidoreductase
VPARLAINDGRALIESPAGIFDRLTSFQYCRFRDRAVGVRARRTGVALCLIASPVYGQSARRGSRGRCEMKAAFIERFGGPEVFQYGDLPDPAAGPGEVVIDIVATSVNAADWKVRLGEYKHTKFPLVPGRDFSGTVSAVGEGVKDIALGDAVFGVCAAGQEGTYAEKVAVKAEIVAKKPSGLSHVNAAALALTGLTAMSAIEETLKLQRGETILIQGGAGGVAGFAIQLAKHIGARVITTASAANHAYVKGLGADEVIDYNAQDFTQAVANCDAVFDTVGGDVAQRSFAVLKPGGRAAFIASGAQAPKPQRADVTALRPPVGRARRHVERIVELFQAGVVRAPEIKLYRLSEAADAHRLSESRHFKGKLVFQVR